MKVLELRLGLEIAKFRNNLAFLIWEVCSDVRFILI